MAAHTADPNPNPTRTPHPNPQPDPILTLTLTLTITLTLSLITRLGEHSHVHSGGWLDRRGTYQYLA